MNGTAVANRLQNSFKITGTDHRIIEILGLRPSNRLPVSYYKRVIPLVWIPNHVILATSQSKWRWHILFRKTTVEEGRIKFQWSINTNATHYIFAEINFESFILSIIVVMLTIQYSFICVFNKLISRKEKKRKIKI